MKKKDDDFSTHKRELRFHNVIGTFAFPEILVVSFTKPVLNI